MAKKIYAVKRGRSTGLFTSWDACKKQVEGFDGARFKGFMNARDALAWLNDTEDTQYIKKTGVSRVEKSASAPSDADYIIYTDGSCLKNPMGPGGWACVIRETATGKITELAEGSPATTNNRMEMRAAIAAVKNRPVYRQPIPKERHDKMDLQLEKTRLEKSRWHRGLKPRSMDRTRPPV